jgi:hypothetical protein
MKTDPRLISCVITTGTFAVSNNSQRFFCSFAVYKFLFLCSSVQNHTCPDAIFFFCYV